MLQLLHGPKREDDSPVLEYDDVDRVEAMSGIVVTAERKDEALVELEPKTASGAVSHKGNYGDS